MRRIAIFVVFTCLIFSFGLVNAQPTYLIEVDFNASSGIFGPANDSVGCDMDIVLALRYTNTSDCRQLPTNAYQISTSDGAMWSGFYGDSSRHTVGGWSDGFDNVLYALSPDGDDGPPADGVGYGGLTIFGDGWVAPYDTIPFSINFHTGDASYAGTHITLDKTSFTGFTWVWSQLACITGSTDDVPPDWGGPYEFIMYDVPDQPPVITGDASVTGSHCVPVSVDFDAVDPDPHPEPPTNTLTFSTDLGSIDPNSGVFAYTGTIADVYETVTANISCVEDDGAISTVPLNIVMTNIAPQPAACGSEYRAKVGGMNELVFVAVDDCTGDPMNWYIVDMGGVIGAAAFVGNVLQYTPDPADVGVHDIIIGVTDTKDAVECAYVLDVSASPEVYIEKVHGQHQGQYADVDVTMSDFGMGGFDFLISYDASALTFMGADEMTSELYNTCDWEYFDYRFGPFGNCGSGCPSGQLRVVGIGEMNDGPHHPGCFSVGTTGIVFTMKFLVSNDYTLNCSYVPIRFYWYDCGDNTISNDGGTELYVSNDVFDYFGTGGVDGYMKITPADKSLIHFPTFLGAEEICLVGEEGKPAPTRFIDFFNGGIDIVCADEIDARGDLNMDGLSNTIADAVMFTNYFVYGLSAFGDYIDGAIAASDVNNDGMTLTVADLVYMIRTVIGDEVAYEKLVAVSAEYSFQNNILAVDGEMGALYVEFDRDANVTLLAEGMEMKENDGKVIVYSLDGNSFSGNVLEVNANVVNIEMATKDGATVTNIFVPGNYALSQNYPNPFNPVTNISFNLSKATDYSMTIYNITGQVVEVFSGSADAGEHTIQWDAQNVASGIYFYKLNADNFSETKKMILLK